MGGVSNNDPTPAVFNTGMVLLGWSALIRRTGETRFKEAARRASDWLISVQEPDGNWIGETRALLPPNPLCTTSKQLGDYAKPGWH